MRHPPLPTDLGVRIKALEEQPLLVPHAAPIPPLLALVVPHGGRLAGAVGVAVLDTDEVLVADRGRVGDGERVAHDGAVERPPHVDDAVPALEQLVGLLGQVVPHPGRGALRRLVNVHAHDGRARVPRPADRVVEEEDLGRARHAVQQQLLHLGVIHALDGLVRGPVVVCHGRRDVGKGGEGVVVHGEVVLFIADVVDGDGVVVYAEVARDAVGWVVRPFSSVVEWLGSELMLVPEVREDAVNIPLIRLLAGRRRKVRLLPAPEDLVHLLGWNCRL
jgi:hypothetical protein